MAENLAQMQQDLGTAMVRFAPQGDLFVVAAQFVGEVRLDADIAVKPNERGRLMRFICSRALSTMIFVLQSIVIVKGKTGRCAFKITASAPFCLNWMLRAQGCDMKSACLLFAWSIDGNMQDFFKLCFYMPRNEAHLAVWAMHRSEVLHAIKTGVPALANRGNFEQITAQ